jgi:hypothetical protein
VEPEMVTPGELNAQNGEQKLASMIGVAAAILIAFLLFSFPIPAHYKWPFPDSQLSGTFTLTHGNSLEDTVIENANPQVDSSEQIELYWFEVNRFQDGVYDVEYEFANPQAT